MLRALLGVNYIGWAARKALSSRPLISAATSSANTELCEGSGWWAAAVGQTISAGVRRSDDSLPYCLLSHDVCEQEQVAGITYVNLTAISTQFQVWRCETLPEASAIFPNIPLILLKVPYTLSSVSSCHYAIVLYSLPSCWLSSRHKESLKDKTTRCCCRSIIIKDPQFFHPLDIGPPFICGRLLIHVTSQWGIPFPDNIIPSLVQTGYLLYSCLSPGESDTQPHSF